MPTSGPRCRGRASHPSCSPLTSGMPPLPTHHPDQAPHQLSGWWTSFNRNNMPNYAILPTRNHTQPHHSPATDTHHTDPAAFTPTTASIPLSPLQPSCTPTLPGAYLPAAAAKCSCYVAPDPRTGACCPPKPDIWGPDQPTCGCTPAATVLPCPPYCQRHAADA